MKPPAPLDMDQIWRDHSRRVLATLIRLLRDFDLAEEALQDAFLTASQKWAVDGLPDNPAAWLVSAGRFRAIDRLRKRIRDRDVGTELGKLATEMAETPENPQMLQDDQLRLIFACCHPALPPEGQVALTLRTVCGLTTEEIARAFLLRPPTLAQRIVRAKQRIKDEGLRYEIPEPSALPARLSSVLRVIYLVFNEGYSAHSGEDALRHDLADEAIRLCRLLEALLPEAEVWGLLGLMTLHQARAPARLTAMGDVVLLADQDRGLWNRAMIDDGVAWVERAFASGQIGPYTLQAAISALHTTAPTAAQTDWREILGLYTVLMRVAPSPVVALNRAIAISMTNGPGPALEIINGLLNGGGLETYHLAHVARADMLRQMGEIPTALAAYGKALDLCQQEPERRFLARKIAELA